MRPWPAAKETMSQYEPLPDRLPERAAPLRRHAQVHVQAPERRRAGDAAYDSYKTRAINHAEQRRIKPGEQANFCRTADVVFAAALAPDKPVLEDFVSGVPVNEANPVDSCEIKVAVALQGVQAGPDISPMPRPALPGDPANPSLFPQ